MRPTTPFKKHPLTIAIQACRYTILGGSPLAVAVPTGGAVDGGSGTISQSGTNTTINQATQNLAVAANERVQFIQPNVSAIALNRILSNNGSTLEIAPMRLKRIFQIIVPLIISSVFLLAACTEPVSTPVSTSTESKVCPESAQQFWKKFRSAVLKDDLNALADMTQFPLEVGGDMDNNPKKFVYRKNFNKHFTQLLSYELNSDYLPITPRPASMKELARAVTEPPSCGKRGDYFYLGTFVFLLNPEGWRLVKVHSNEFMYAETEEPLHTTPPKE